VDLVWVAVWVVVWVGALIVMALLLYAVAVALGGVP